MAKGRYAATKAEVARLVPCRYQTLLEYWKLPGFPENHAPGKARYDIEAIRRFIHERKSAHNFGGNGRNGNGHIGEREQALIEKNRIAAMAAKFDYDIKTGEYVRRLDVNRDIDTACAIIKRELIKLVQQILPPKLEGLPAARMSRVGMEELNRVLKFLPGHFEKAASNGNGNGS